MAHGLQVTNGLSFHIKEFTMKLKILTAIFLILTISQTACLTTVHTRPHYHDEYCGHGHHHERTVRVYHPRRVYIPVHRPAPTVVTVRRY
jgi:hypothetical protein